MRDKINLEHCKRAIHTHTDCSALNKECRFLLELIEKKDRALEIARGKFVKIRQIVDLCMHQDECPCLGLCEDHAIDALARLDTLNVLEQIK